MKKNFKADICTDGRLDFMNFFGSSPHSVGLHNWDYWCHKRITNFHISIEHSPSLVYQES